MPGFLSHSEAASHSILQYIGNTIVYAGTHSERKKCRQYMKWLFAQLDGPVAVYDGPTFNFLSESSVKMKTSCLLK